MKRICIQCQTEMINDCKINVEYDLSGITIKQKCKGLFKSASARTKASVCPNCGFVALYIEEYEKFNK